MNGGVGPYCAGFVVSCNALRVEWTLFGLVLHCLVLQCAMNQALFVLVVWCLIVECSVDCALFRMVL